MPSDRRHPRLRRRADRQLSRRNGFPGSETVMQMLERRFGVSTAYGGGFVESIDGHAGGLARDRLVLLRQRRSRPEGRRRDRRRRRRPHLVGPARLAGHRLDPGGRRLLPRAVPQRHRRQALPDDARVRDPDVAGLQRGRGVAEARREFRCADQYLGGGSGSDSLAIVVGTWAQVKGVVAAELIDGGPRSSGVYARFVGSVGSGARASEPEPATSCRRCARRAGLIAALEDPSLGQPTWLVTGTDEAGVNAAAGALTPARLRDHFALAVDGAQDIPVPVPGEPMMYRRRSSPLHAARARRRGRVVRGARVRDARLSNPLALGAVCVAVLAAGLICRRRPRAATRCALCDPARRSRSC